MVRKKLDITFSFNTITQITKTKKNTHAKIKYKPNKPDWIEMDGGINGGWFNWARNTDEDDDGEAGEGDEIVFLTGVLFLISFWRLQNFNVINIYIYVLCTHKTPWQFIKIIKLPQFIG